MRLDQVSIRIRAVFMATIFLVCLSPAAPAQTDSADPLNVDGPTLQADSPGNTLASELDLPVPALKKMDEILARSDSSATCTCDADEIEVEDVNFFFDPKTGQLTTESSSTVARGISAQDIDRYLDSLAPPSLNITETSEVTQTNSFTSQNPPAVPQNTQLCVACGWVGGVCNSIRDEAACEAKRSPDLCGWFNWYGSIYKSCKSHARVYCDNLCVAVRRRGGQCIDGEVSAANPAPGFEALQTQLNALEGCGRRVIREARHGIGGDVVVRRLRAALACGRPIRIYLDACSDGALTEQALLAVFPHLQEEIKRYRERTGCPPPRISVVANQCSATVYPTTLDVDHGAPVEIQILENGQCRLHLPMCAALDDLTCVTDHPGSLTVAYCESSTTAADGTKSYKTECRQCRPDPRDASKLIFQTTGMEVCLDRLIDLPSSSRPNSGCVLDTLPDVLQMRKYRCQVEAKCEVEDPPGTTGTAFPAIVKTAEAYARDESGAVDSIRPEGWTLAQRHCREKCGNCPALINVSCSLVPPAQPNPAPPR